MTSSPLARSPSEYPWTWFFVVVLLLVPLFVVDIPPILDYPNHLARLYLLGPAAADPILSQFYQAQWFRMFEACPTGTRRRGRAGRP